MNCFINVNFISIQLPRHELVNLILCFKIRRKNFDYVKSTVEIEEYIISWK